METYQITIHFVGSERTADLCGIFPENLNEIRNNLTAAMVGETLIRFNDGNIVMNGKHITRFNIEKERPF